MMLNYAVVCMIKHHVPVILTFSQYATVVPSRNPEGNANAAPGTGGNFFDVALKHQMIVWGDEYDGGGQYGRPRGG